jgi:membrane associated rhomboid family serine protease
VLHDPEQPIEVFRAPGRKPCQERALVLQARGLPYQIIGQPNDYRLIVPAEHAAVAIEELAEYGAENEGWPPHRPGPPVRSNGRVGAAVWAVTLIAIHPAGRLGLLGHDIWNPGKLIAGKVMEGEWWRAVTALTLHGGIGHLVGNLVSGAAFIVLSSQTLGGGLAFLGTVLAGALGNLLNSALQPATHTAIGASTAVFGCLGLLSCYEWMRRHALGQRAIRRWAPLMAGAALLGYLGMGGGDAASPGAPRTDVLAHFTGFVCGMGLGFFAGWTRLPERISPLGQRVCAALAGGLVVLGWTLALS